MTDLSPRNSLVLVEFLITAVHHESTPEFKIYLFRAIEFKKQAQLSSIGKTNIKRFFGWLFYIGNRTNDSLIKGIITTLL